MCLHGTYSEREEYRRHRSYCAEASREDEKHIASSCNQWMRQCVQIYGHRKNKGFDSNGQEDLDSLTLVIWMHQSVRLFPKLLSSSAHATT